MSVWGGIRRLERQQAKRAASEPDNLWYQFRVAASCPPDKTLVVDSYLADPVDRDPARARRDALHRLDGAFSAHDPLGGGLPPR